MTIRNFKEEFKKRDRLLLELREKNAEHNHQKHNDETRSKIALFFTYGFFGLMSVAFLGTLIYNYKICSNVAENSYKVCSESSKIDLKDTVLFISGTLGGMYGLVLGYYFKGDDDKNK